MKSIQTKDEELKISDTSVYGSYLLPKFCYQLGCTQSEYLVEVKENRCHCMFKKPHVHCKNCGGICSVG